MAKTYHLWAQPSGKVYDFFATTIDALSRMYQSPVFEPHVTLLSALPGTEEEIIDRLSQLAETLREFPIQLTNPAYGDQYFQCVFLPARTTPEILHAHEMAKHRFGVTSFSFMPHLSLLYGHYPIHLKKEIAQTLPANLCREITADRIVLIRSCGDHPRHWIPAQTVVLGK